jgi:outer membrane murein-binding lipoprotein Lpp
MNASQVKKFVVDLITEIISRCDAKVAEQKAMVDKVSADAAALSAQVEELKAALVAADMAKAAALADAANTASSELDAITTELAAEFGNPTPTADVVSEVVAESSDVPAIAETAPEVGEPVATPEAATQEVVEAVGEVVEEAAMG